MSFIYQDLRDRERTCIKEKVKSRSKYTCSEIPYDPVEMTDFGPNFIGPYLMNDSDFQVAIVLIIFDLFQYRK